MGNGASPLVNITLGANGQSSSAVATTGLMAPERIYVYDGSSFQVYNPQDDSWEFGTAPPTVRQYLGTANVNDKLYFIGGTTDDPSGLPGYPIDLDTNEQYTPIGYGTLQTTTSPTPAIPELSLIIIPLLLSIMLASTGLLVYHKKHKHNSVKKV